MHERQGQSPRNSGGMVLDVLSSGGGGEEKVVVESVFVAVAAEFESGEKTVQWALDNLCTQDGGGTTRLFIAHVDLTVAEMVATVEEEATVDPQRVSDQKKKLRAEAEAKLDQYVIMCQEQKVSCEKLIIEKDDVAEGLEELITNHGINKLVMGAAADKKYSEKMKSPDSKKAARLTFSAASSCKIWFICNGHLICTREGNTTVPAISSGARFTVPARIRTDSDEIRFRSILKTKFRRKSIEIWPENPESGRFSVSTPHQEICLKQNGLPCSGDDLSMNEGTEQANVSSPHEQENMGVDADGYDTVNEHILAATQAKLLSALEKITGGEDLEIKLALKKQIENMVLSLIEDYKVVAERNKYHMRKLQEQAETDKNDAKQFKKMMKAFRDVKKKEKVLKEQNEKMGSLIEDQKVRIETNKCLLQKMQQERDAARTEAEVLRQKNDQKISLALLPAETTEFSCTELEEATQGFNEALKISEGIYKGFLRKTEVIIKLLDPKSMHGQSEFFNQEVASLGRVRHPNLVTLMGACRDVFALVYEFLPNGSLEERLACANNTPPLTWQVRTSIIGDMWSVLSFLHSNKPNPVVHGDLKAHNILLDANFVSKLRDLGIRRLLAGNSSGDSELTPLSDMAFFGVIILRLLTGKPTEGITEAVRKAMEHELHNVVDSSAGYWPPILAKQLAQVGLLCADMSQSPNLHLQGDTDMWEKVDTLMKAALRTTGGHLSTAVSEDDEDTPWYFLCPILNQVMSDPYVAADGFTYEADAIREWLGMGNLKSPMTRERLVKQGEKWQDSIRPNKTMKTMIDEWEEKKKRHKERMRSLVSGPNPPIPGNQDSPTIAPSAQPEPTTGLPQAPTEGLIQAPASQPTPAPTGLTQAQPASQPTILVPSARPHRLAPRPANGPTVEAPPPPRQVATSSVSLQPDLTTTTTGLRRRVNRGSQRT